MFLSCLLQFGIMCKENLPGAEWYEVGPGDCIPYWPKQEGDKQMVACIKGTALETRPFWIAEAHTTLLKLYHDVCT